MEAKEVKQLLRLEDVLDKYGIERTGNRYLCPFHKDTRASMTIKNENYRCWSCGATGDIFTFTQEHFGLKFGDAITKLNADFALGLSDEKPKQSTATRPLDTRFQNESKERYIEQLRTFHRWCIRNGKYAKADEIFNELNLIEGVNIGH